MFVQNAVHLQGLNFLCMNYWVDIFALIMNVGIAIQVVHQISIQGIVNLYLIAK